MAKEKETVSDFEKKYGKVCISGDFILEQEKKIISMSPRMDIGLSGGIPEGCWVLCSGQPKRGKTTCILQLCANAQKQGKKIRYLDVEHRLKPMNLGGIAGLKTDEDNFRIVRSEKGNILNAEQFLNAGTDMLHAEEDIVLVIDSVSALCSSAETIGEITSQARNAGAKLMANFWRKNKDIVPVQNSIVIMIIHLIANTSGYGAKWNEDGGQKIQYACDVKIRNKSTADWLEGEKLVGIMPEWEIETSALGPACKSVKQRIRFGIGADETAELMDVGLEFGLISQAGAWYSCDFVVSTPELSSFCSEDSKKNMVCKFQGEANLYKFLKENPTVQQKLNELIRSMI